MLFWKRKKDDSPAGRAGLTTLFGNEAVPTPSVQPTAEAAPEVPAPTLPEPAVPVPVVPEIQPPVMPAPPIPAPIPTPVQTPVAEEEKPKTGFLKRMFGRGESTQPEPAPTPAPVAPVSEEPEKERFFLRMKKAVQRTRQNLVGRMDTVFRGRKTISPEILEELEEILIGSDIGVQTALDLVEKIRQQVNRKLINDTDELKKLLRSELLAILTAPTRSLSGKAVRSETDIAPDIRPYVMMMVGVNGVGKTTTIAKLAHLIKREGNDVMVCAADTFRAAAADQLSVWAERLDIPVIQQKPGTDPAAVVYDSLQAAKARDTDVVIVDTAGRLHNKINLMNELEKMSRIAGREVPQAPHEVLLVLDAATGQNGLEQARQFTKTVPVTGIVLTKLDGTAKGGIVVAIARELGVPIRYVGTGEQIDDLTVFSPEEFVNSLFE
jgi:fused signal recognition particle receptor